MGLGVKKSRGRRHRSSRTGSFLNVNWPGLGIGMVAATWVQVLKLMPF